MKKPRLNSIEMLSAKWLIKRGWDKADVQYLRRNPEKAVEAKELVAEYEAELARKKTVKDNADEQKADKGFRK